ncbi:RNA polymerase sigma-70 factor (ECF subfamily) [Mucilaginibacter gracilis]|uniref:RNA polymerase sigma-70 factor (ECF subfamily) n=1 Tax=Mucilaginibacter gracilis TaxID=423350 RepID=A0A495JAS1_9SPHI|nr:sigma-70 family RNA polymerase sigma factor [Mucilaginibacter gracilis]RKR85504.1 RNA polymerase sigma-70 factor (ECF subfamily) [Mucilaginibacter gracilis]
MNWFNNSQKTDKATDEALLKRYRDSGDLAVLAELFKPYSSMVYYVCLRYLQDGEQSKDAVMQIFEELISKVNKQEIKQFASWLYVLSRNYCLMQLRSAKKMQYTTIDDFMELPIDLHQDVENKEKQLTALELCMEKLPPAQKQSINLFFMNEKCYKEITEITGYTLNDVKSYIQNGKRNLKICIEKNGER